MGAMDRIVRFDEAAGEIEVEAGIQWPALMDFLVTSQRGQARQWGIIQKQSGADQFSLGGALASNVHGHGLAFKPIIANVVSFTLVDGEGRVLTVAVDQHAELFRLAIGGYGLFGVIASVRLRLGPRQKLGRLAEMVKVSDLMVYHRAARVGGGALRRLSVCDRPGVGRLSEGGCPLALRPVDPGTPIPTEQQAPSSDDWLNLLYLAHIDKRQAVDAYTARTLATSGQISWSDLHQLSDYVAGYHRVIDERMGVVTPATETISEIYVPRPALPRFLEEVRDDFRAHDVDLIYGSIRLIERDDESFLAWARVPWACVIVNLHTVHTRPVSPRPPRRSAACCSRDRARRELLPDLPPLGHPRPGRSVLIRGSSQFLRLKRQLRSGRTVPERLVPPLPEHVRRSPSSRADTSDRSPPAERRSMVHLMPIVALMLLLTPLATTAQAATPAPARMHRRAQAPQRSTRSTSLPSPLPPGQPGALIRWAPLPAPGRCAGLAHPLPLDGPGWPRCRRLRHGVRPRPPGAAGRLPADRHGPQHDRDRPGLRSVAGPVPPAARGERGVLSAAGRRLCRWGFVVVATDYQGLGAADGVHPFLVGETAAYNVLDAARAARALPDLDLGPGHDSSGDIRKGAMPPPGRASSLRPTRRTCPSPGSSLAPPPPSRDSCSRRRRVAGGPAPSPLTGYIVTLVYAWSQVYPEVAAAPALTPALWTRSTS